MTVGQSVVIVDDEASLALVMRMLVLKGWPDSRVSLYTETNNLATRLLDVPVGSVVLMDRRLDGVDSYDMVAGLMGSRPDLRVVMLSASLGPEERASGRAAGAVAAYEKPGAVGAWHDLLTQVMAPPVNL